MCCPLAIAAADGSNVGRTRPPAHLREVCGATSLRRVRWTNVALALGTLAVLAAVIAWPLMTGSAPRLPADTPRHSSNWRATWRPATRAGSLAASGMPGVSTQAGGTEARSLGVARASAATGEREGRRGGAGDAGEGATGEREGPAVQARAARAGRDEGGAGPDAGGTGEGEAGGTGAGGAGRAGRQRAGRRGAGAGETARAARAEAAQRRPLPRRRPPPTRPRPTPRAPARADGAPKEFGFEGKR